MVKRLENWPIKLSHFLRARREMPFAWGTNDCMAFVSGCVKELTGTDYFPDYSDYEDEESANSMLFTNGGVDGIVTACLGGGHDKWKMAQRGDVALVNLPYPMGGIVDDSGQKIAVVTEGGMIRVPLSKAQKIWSY